jgi:hypothetical protein
MEVSGEGEEHNIILASKQTESDAFKDICQSVGKSLDKCKEILRT